MRIAFFPVVMLTLATIAALSFTPGVRHYGQVSCVSPDPRYGLARIYVTGWDRNTVPENVDSALHFTRDAQVLWLVTRNCSDADSECMKEVLGRFVSYGIPGLPKSGDHPWNGPLFVQIADTTNCTIPFRLRQRRWTEIVVGEGEEHLEKVDAALTDLIRRYQRERVDRLEDLFRK